MDKAIYNRLTTDTGVAALTSARVYAALVPQNPTYPCIAYTQISDSAFRTLTSDTNVSRAVYEVSCYARTYSEARELADAVRSALKRLRGTYGSILVFDSETNVGQVLYDDQLGVYAVPLDVSGVYQTA